MPLFTLLPIRRIPDNWASDTKVFSETRTAESREGGAWRQSILKSRAFFVFLALLLPHHHRDNASTVHLVHAQDMAIEGDLVTNLGHAA